LNRVPKAQLDELKLLFHIWEVRVLSSVTKPDILRFSDSPCSTNANTMIAAQIGHGRFLLIFTVNYYTNIQRYLARHFEKKLLNYARRSKSTWRAESWEDV